MPQAGVPATALESRVPAAGSRQRDVLMSDEGSGLPVHLTQMSTPRMLTAPHLTGSPPQNERRPGHAVGRQSCGGCGSDDSVAVGVWWLQAVVALC